MSLKPCRQILFSCWLTSSGWSRRPCIWSPKPCRLRLHFSCCVTPPVSWQTSLPPKRSNPAAASSEFVVWRPVRVDVPALPHHALVGAELGVAPALPQLNGVAAAGAPRNLQKNIHSIHLIFAGNYHSNDAQMFGMVCLMEIHALQGYDFRKNSRLLFAKKIFII